MIDISGQCEPCGTAIGTCLSALVNTPSSTNSTRLAAAHMLMLRMRHCIECAVFLHVGSRIDAGSACELGSRPRQHTKPRRPH